MTKLFRVDSSLWRIEGELTFTTVTSILDQLPYTDAGKTTKVDFSGLHRCDSAGLALIVAWEL